MSDTPVRVRFAPSPTGYLHVGGARTALFNYLFARANNGTFILRIEDTDRTRFQEDSLTEIFESMKWLGLEWDEGPEKGGEYGPYIQSERTDKYQKYAQQLIDHGHAYYCFCTSERLDMVRKEREKNKEQQAGYDRHCRDLDVAEAKKRIEAGEKYVVRLKIPLNTTITFQDGIRGEITYDTAQLDDIVLLKSDGFPTYHLASVVDDHHMEISHVLRGDEWIASTPRHVVLYEALGWKTPVFAHLPVILSPTGGKLSKRKGAASVMDYKVAGFLPDALVNFLSLLGWNPGDDQELMSREQLEKLFSLDRVSPKPSVFDEQKLEWMNGQYLIDMADDAILSEVKPLWEEKEWIQNYADNYLLTVISLMKQRVKKVTELADTTSYFFNDIEEYNAKAVKKRFLKGTPIEVLTETLKLVQESATFDRDAAEQMLIKVAESLETGAGNVNPVVRLAVTGEGGGPDLFDMMALFGKDVVIDRIEKAMEWIKQQV